MKDEARIQKSLIDWWALACRAYKLDARLLSHCPNGGKLGKIKGAILKSMGVRAGHEDLMLAVPIRRDGQILIPGLYIELKSSKGRISPQQQEMMALHSAQGFAVCVAWSFDDGVRAITNYLKHGNPLLK